MRVRGPRGIEFRHALLFCQLYTSHCPITFIRLYAYRLALEPPPSGSVSIGGTMASLPVHS